MPVKEMLTGCLLGDSTILYPNKNSSAARVRFRHGDPQKDYVHYKYKLLKTLCLSPPKRIINPGYGAYSWTFQTMCLPWLNEFYSMCWQGTCRIVGDGLREHLTPEALAYWYMDDGSLEAGRKHSCYLHTNRFSRYGQEKMARWLMDLYGIEVRHQLDKHHNQYLLKINTKPASILFETVAPFMIPSMRYKLPVEIEQSIPFVPVSWEVPDDLRKLCEICGKRYARNKICSHTECKQAKLARDNRKWYLANAQRISEEKLKRHIKEIGYIDCEICGAHFLARSKTQRVCSLPDCQMEHRRRRALAHYHKNKILKKDAIPRPS